MSERRSVKVLNGALDEGPNGTIILRGVIAPESLRLLKIAPYQREVLPQAKIDELVVALTDGTVPDIEIGVRGGAVTERPGAFYIYDDAYIVDGQQRREAALRRVAEEKDPHLGAVFHFNTNERWERERFRLLNQDRTKLSPNVLLRNQKEDNPLVQLLFSLTTEDRDFVLCDRVTWNQRMRRQELMTAMTLLRVVGGLHSHLGPGRSTTMMDLSRQVRATADKIGNDRFEANVREFFRVVDKVWGIRRIVYKDTANWMRTTFLCCLADLFGRHQDFWRDDGNELFVEASIVKKLALFPLRDPSVAGLMSNGGKSNEMLFMMLRSHVNSGKRTRRLKAWPGMEDLPGDDPNLSQGNEE